ncbi:Acetylornithine/succinyldiaminopimelate aminotransferase [Streptomyces rimosus subsp. rimosus]
MVSTTGGFHGRTMGALALTGQPAKQDPFRPLPATVHLGTRRRDTEALRAAVTTDTALVIIEPVQGENGVVVPPGYLAAAREITAATGTLLVLDEIQTGIGRTGHWLESQAQGVEADVIALAEGSAAACPSAPPSPSARPPACSPPAPTARPSAATRSCARARSPSWTPSRPTDCSTTSSGSASGCVAGSRRRRTRSSARSAVRACSWVSSCASPSHRRCSERLRTRASW